ncbi:hypothetical protein EDB19DRAFT_1823863 [Suillus lakei]|nr:hypothetical protein EDB19DRAFT_1823863 [Suillus lakei]
MRLSVLAVVVALTASISASDADSEACPWWCLDYSYCTGCPSGICFWIYCGQVVERLYNFIRWSRFDLERACFDLIPNQNETLGRCANWASPVIRAHEGARLTERRDQGGMLVCEAAGGHENEHILEAVPSMLRRGNVEKENSVHDLREVTWFRGFRRTAPPPGSWHAALAFLRID